MISFKFKKHFVLSVMMEECSDPIGNLMSILMLPAGGNEINPLWLVRGDMPNNKNDFAALRRNFHLREIATSFVIFPTLPYHKDTSVPWQLRNKFFIKMPHKMFLLKGKSLHNSLSISARVCKHNNRGTFQCLGYHSKIHNKSMTYQVL